MNEPFRVNILTIFPEMFESFFSSSILGRAGEQGLIDIRTTDIRPYSKSKHHNTDDYPFGGGAGMVMMAQPILDAMSAVMAEYPSARRIYLGPRGKKLTTSLARELAQEKALVLLCGHYEGVDQRALDSCVDEEISIGEESFSDGLLEYPQYTRPRDLDGMQVPEVLLNGDHARIRSWRRRESLKATLKYRPDLLETAPLDEKDRKMLNEIRKELTESCSSEN